MKNVNLGIKNGQWKGDKVQYGSLHDYIKYHSAKPSNCQNCGKVSRLDLANISQEYKRDLNDWEWLCRFCHMKKDGRSEKLAEKGRAWGLKQKGSKLSEETKLKISIKAKKRKRDRQGKFVKMPKKGK